MKYTCKILNNQTAIVTIAPTNNEEKEYLEKLNEDNTENHDILYSHFYKGIKQCNYFAELLSIVNFQRFPFSAICTFAIAKGMGV